MASSSSRRKRNEFFFFFICLLFLCSSFLDLTKAHQGHSHSIPNIHHHHCGGDHDHHHDHDHAHDHVHQQSKLLPEELAEEEDMKLYGFGLPHHDHHHFTASTELSGLGIFSILFLLLHCKLKLTSFMFISTISVPQMQLFVKWVLGFIKFRNLGKINGSQCFFNWGCKLVKTSFPGLIWFLSL